MKTFLLELKTSLLLTLVLAALLCGAYPLAVWAGAQAFFPAQANGSLVSDQDGTVRGSLLLAQNFSSDQYFQPRPSAAGTGYDAANSSGTNLGPTSQKLISLANAGLQAARIAKARQLPLAQVQALIARAARDRDWGILGEPTVNVLQLNLALDQHASSR